MKHHVHGECASFTRWLSVVKWTISSRITTTLPLSNKTNDIRALRSPRARMRVRVISRYNLLLLQRRRHVETFMRLVLLYPPCGYECLDVRVNRYWLLYKAENTLASLRQCTVGGSTRMVIKLVGRTSSIVPNFPFSISYLVAVRFILIFSLSCETVTLESPRSQKYFIPCSSSRTKLKITSFGSELVELNR